ncbi:prepilin-type N-terminal cleavage/methylation domain-containing protein [Salinibius halmophilus]|uniref:prepilin-type N-terminal cleavage/methylation domain-containing protein n=1 Tax=Salinibius halmophilus TaxID=1853216 RepID=UPI000E660B06|nr:prepilin-type N-terminal cleavage/methylation domain-containing protein [Salinibius halmophilus]
MKQQGLTLVELMISMVLGLILTAGVISLFIQSQRSYSATRDIAILDQNAQVIFDMIERDLQRIGFTPGCRTYDGPLTANLLAAGTKPLPFVGDRFGTNPQLKGYNTAAGSPLVDAYLTEMAASVQGNIKPDTDFFMVWAGTPDKVGAITAQSGGQYSARFDDSVDDLNGEVVMISSPDCTQVAQFLQSTDTAAGGTSVTHTGIQPVSGASLDGLSNCEDKESGSFDCSATGSAVDDTITPAGAIMVLEYFGYAVDKNDQLIRISAIGSPDYQVLTGGVTDFTVEYGSHSGVTSNGVYSVARYDSATNVPNWSSVIALRVSFTLEGDTFVTTDKFSKRYSRLITLRNLVIE